MCGFSAGLPLVRFLYPRWTSLWAALSRARPDVVYQRGAGAETGQAALWCRLHERPFLFAAASNSDCDPELPYLPRRRERVLYRWGLRRADRVVAQTREQVEAFRKGFGIRAVLIRSCSQDPGPPPPREPVTAGRPSVLWVGRFSYEKRPELMLEVARRCPEIQFDVVGAANAGRAAGDEVARRARGLANVTLHGRVPHDRMAGFYARTSALLLTSAWEGYPNTFLEAWARGVPTVSTVDPDGAIARYGLGFVGESGEDLAAGVKRLVSDAAVWRACSIRARRLFFKRHTIAAAAGAYEALIAELVAGGRPVRPRDRGGPASSGEETDVACHGSPGFAGES
jgi:glycosyltransferase involved in cell wall biosynthesis